MGFLTVIVEYVAAFAAGFFGHVVAHDFCEVAPMISRKIVEIAASWLPEPIRDRYLEEWRADLRDQPGAIAKLNWSIGCLLSASHIRRQAVIDRARRSSFEFVLSTGESVMIDVPTMAVFISLGQLFRILKASKLPRAILTAGSPVISVALWIAMEKPTLQWRKCGKPDYGMAVKLFNDLIAEGPSPKITWYFDGVAVKLPTKKK